MRGKVIGWDKQNEKEMAKDTPACQLQSVLGVFTGSKGVQELGAKDGVRGRWWEGFEPRGDRHIGMSGENCLALWVAFLPAAGVPALSANNYQ